MSEGASEPGRSRASVLAEALFLGGFSLALLVWIIPAQTSEGGIGLSPAFLPEVCAAAIGILVLLDGAGRLLRGAPAAAYPEGWAALLRIGGISLLGGLVLAWAGVTAAALATCAAGLLVLGERRPLVIAATLLICGGAVWLVFG